MPKANSPGSRVPESLPWWREVGLLLIQFVQGQLLVACLNGLVAWGGFSLLGIRPALWLGAGVGLTSVIPYAGPVLGFLPALILAWTSFHDLRIVAAVVGLGLLIQILEVLVFQPYILGSKLKVHPLLVMVSFVFWGALLGFVGVLLAVPLTALMQVLWRRFRTRWS